MSDTTPTFLGDPIGLVSLSVSSVPPWGRTVQLYATHVEAMRSAATDCSSAAAFAATSPMIGMYTRIPGVPYGSGGGGSIRPRET